MELRNTDIRWPISTIFFFPDDSLSALEDFCRLFFWVCLTHTVPEALLDGEDDVLLVFILIIFCSLVLLSPFSFLFCFGL